jgi:hypothetical protein
MWLKIFSSEHLKWVFSRPVLTLLNLQGLDVRAGVIMIGSVYFLNVALTINASVPGI